MSHSTDDLSNLSCPVPIGTYKQILLAHGGGGKLTHQLIQEMIAPQFANELLSPLHDGAVFSVKGGHLAFSTDSFVVNPIFFPGGTIGDLAVNGTVNDLAMCGAKPRYLSAAFIIEEGMTMEELWRVIVSMKDAADRAGVMLVTGDTKVVDRGKGDKIFITTSGVGILEDGVNIHPANARPGDVVILSGPIGLHGIAVLSIREGLEFETEIMSDTAALNSLVENMLHVEKNIRVLRDPTRGGIASALNEIAESAGVGIMISEENIPVPEEVRGACEILGLDPLYVANEGKLLAVVPPESAGRILTVMRSHPLGRDAVAIGEIMKSDAGIVLMKTRVGSTRVVNMLSGEQLPRIC